MLHKKRNMHARECEIWICREDFVGVNHPKTAGVFQDVFAEGGCVASVPDP